MRGGPSSTLNRGFLLTRNTDRSRRTNKLQNLIKPTSRMNKMKLVKQRHQTIRTRLTKVKIPKLSSPRLAWCPN
jgi:hypothetical protein